MDKQQVSSLEQRITELEVKLGFSEDLLDQLNQTVYRQQQALERLAHLLADLRDQAAAQGNARPVGDLRDEQPPHY